MKYVISIIILTAILLYIGDFKLTLSPFSISLTGWRVVVGWLFFLLAWAFWMAHFYDSGLNRGRDITIEKLEQIIEENRNEREE